MKIEINLNDVNKCMHWLFIFITAQRHTKEQSIWETCQRYINIIEKEIENESIT